MKIDTGFGSCDSNDFGKGHPLTPASATRTMDGAPIDPKPVGPLREANRETARHDLKMQLILSAVQAELESATRKHGPMNTPHEAFGVIYEEFMIEFAAAMHANDREQQRREMLQVAAMACRFLYDLGSDQ